MYAGLLLFESVSLTMIVVGVFTNVVHLFMLRTFPFIELSSPSFILSVGKKHFDVANTNKAIMLLVGKKNHIESKSIKGNGELT